MFFPCLQLTKGPDGKRSPGWVMVVLYLVNMRSRDRCSKWINITGLNLCLDFKIYSLCALCISEDQAYHSDFSKMDSHTSILNTCYSSMQSYFKINLIFTFFFNVKFPYRKS